MSFKELKKDYIKLRREELEYFNEVLEESNKRLYSEKEKLDIHRKANKYEKNLSELMSKMLEQACLEEFYSKYGLRNIIFTFKVDNNIFSSIKSEDRKRRLLRNFYIDMEDYKGKLNMLLLRNNYYKTFDIDRIMNNQQLIDIPLYIYKWDYDATEECCGPLFGDYEDYQYCIYDRLDKYGKDIEVKKLKREEYEKDKTVLKSRPRVNYGEVLQIFDEELLNEENNSIQACIDKTQARVDHLYETRTPEYKEQRLLERINKLYEKSKGKCIDEKVLYNGKFIDLIKESYELPNGKIVEKEKVIKNNNKNSVIVVALDKDNNYILNFQQRIKDTLIVEFPSGFIEDNEEPLATAKRELEEETGYTSDDMYTKLNASLEKLKSSTLNIEKYLEENKKIQSEYDVIKVLSDTANGSLTGKQRITFENYVQSYFMQTVLVEANKRLIKMTDSRYELKRKETEVKLNAKTGLDFSIFDSYTGKERDVASLSGGEKFKASLALALGLSDAISNNRGGIKIDSLFIDEGFGSLDSESLNQALNILSNLSGNDKLVGVISHVSELMSRIDNKILVNKTNTGSIVNIESTN